jgi:hypothetical protein
MLHPPAKNIIQSIYKTPGLSISYSIESPEQTDWGSLKEKVGVFLNAGIDHWDIFVQPFNALGNPVL